MATLKEGGRPSYMGDRLRDISCWQIFILVLGLDKFPLITLFDLLVLSRTVSLGLITSLFSPSHIVRDISKINSINDSHRIIT